MPTYRYRCPDCDHRLELLQTAAEMRSRRPQMRCSRCEGRMQFIFPAPAIRTGKQFRGNRGDGFGHDERGRRRAHAKARAQGISTSGKWWSPQLNAWIGGDDDVKRICQQRRLACSGSVNYTPPPKEPEPEKPYQVAEDIAEREVQDVLEEHGHEMTSKEIKELPEKTREELSGVW